MLGTLCQIYFKGIIFAGYNRYYGISTSMT